MSSGIFVIGPDDSVQEMFSESYDSESVLQKLLAKFPGLLSGDESGESRHRYVLVSREFGVPDKAEGHDRWSLDHLFIDDQAIPTLVEVKRKADTRSRREVIAQMLDYAANGVLYWPPDHLRSQFVARCQAESLDPSEVLSTHLGGDSDFDGFWSRVGMNLNSGTIRMVFVADEIRPELKRIVEFLNEQMTPADVIAIEVKQYSGGGLRTLVARVIGQTAAAERAKRETPPGRAWDDRTFFEELEEQCTAETSAGLREVFAFVPSLNGEIEYGKAHHGSATVSFELGGRVLRPLKFWAWGSRPFLNVQFGSMKSAGVPIDILRNSGATCPVGQASTRHRVSPKRNRGCWTKTTREPQWCSWMIRWESQVSRVRSTRPFRT